MKNDLDGLKAGDDVVIETRHDNKKVKVIRRTKTLITTEDGRRWNMKGQRVGCRTGAFGGILKPVEPEIVQ